MPAQAGLRDKRFVLVNHSSSTLLIQEDMHSNFQCRQGMPGHGTVQQSTARVPRELSPVAARPPLPTRDSFLCPPVVFAAVQPFHSWFEVYGHIHPVNTLPNMGEFSILDRISILGSILEQLYIFASNLHSELYNHSKMEPKMYNIAQDGYDFHLFIQHVANVHQKAIAPYLGTRFRETPTYGGWSRAVRGCYPLGNHIRGFADVVALARVSAQVGPSDGYS
ncbi:hypothetical protein PM082_003617 [Marasmius tenuissimus]|nr:hypothetical protein PM082_003617 [Marasmius tenuissimus]